MAYTKRLLDAIRRYTEQQTDYSTNAHEIDLHKDEHDGPGMRASSRAVREAEAELEAALIEALGGS